MSAFPQGAGVMRIAHEQPNALACLHKAVEVYGVSERHDFLESILFLVWPSLLIGSIKYTGISAQEALVQTLGLQGVRCQQCVRPAPPTALLLVETCIDEHSWII